MIALEVNTTTAARRSCVPRVIERSPPRCQSNFAKRNAALAPALMLSSRAAQTARDLTIGRALASANATRFMNAAVYGASKPALQL